MSTSMMDQIKTLNSSLEKKDLPKAQDTTTLLPTNKRDPPLEGGHSTKIIGMWTIKYEVNSTKLYEILINTELKVDTDLDLNNLYNHINMCLNADTRLLEDLLPAYKYIKRRSDFK